HHHLVGRVVLKDYFCFSTHKQDNDLQLEEDSRSLLFFYPYTKEEAALLRQPLFIFLMFLFLRKCFTTWADVVNTR
ncbi:hypothetical protein DQQ10_21315, partial [Pseudochryseolinea flava]